jgi:hypothetical protein
MAHFSSRKSNKESFYDPAMKILEDVRAGKMPR